MGGYAIDAAVSTFAAQGGGDFCDLGMGFGRLSLF